MNKISLIHDDSIDSKTKRPFTNKVDMDIEFDSLDDLGKLICEFHITPGTFVDNVRSKKTLKSINYIVYDFDDGTLSKDIHDRLTNGDTINKKKYNHLISGSKNHLKDKNDGKGIIERFHLFVPLDKPISNSDDYNYIWKRFKYVCLNGFTVDESVSDCSRYLFKHSCVLFKISNHDNISNDKWIENRTISKPYYHIQFPKPIRYINNIVMNNNDSPLNKFKKSKGWRMLTQEMFFDGNRYSTGNKIIGIMKLCGLELTQAIRLFDQYSTYGESHNPQSIETRWHKY